MGKRIKRLWDAIKERLGVKTAIGVAVATFTLIPDWQSRIVYWKDAVTSMVHLSWFPAALRIFIFAIGVGLIVWDAIGKRASHHIKITGIQSTFLSYHEDHGRYDLESDGYGRNQKAYVVDIFNVPALPHKKSKGTGKVRAQVTVNFRGRDFVLAPLAWAGEYFSAVEIEPGETRQAILTVAETIDGTNFWKVVLNRRSNDREAISIHPAWDLPLGLDGMLWIELVSCESGSVIAKIEIQWQCSYTPPLCGPTSIKQLL